MAIKNYRVVIHYEGSVSYDIAAESEEAAKGLAETFIEEESAENIIADIDWDVCDIWEE